MKVAQARVKILGKTLFFIAGAIALVACGQTRGKKGAVESALKCRFGGTYLGQEYDFGFANPLDCISIGRADKIDRQVMGIELWSSISKVMPQVIFAVSSPTNLIVDKIYSVLAFGSATEPDKPHSIVQFPPGD